MNLRKLANGEECDIRVPHVCCGDSTRVVLCHLRMAGISGYGLKAPDALAAFGCQPCHDVVDGRVPSPYSYDELRALLLEGMARTQYKLIQRGVLKW